MGATYAQRKALGAVGESAAAQFLTARGLEVLDRNWRCRDGEIDLVAWDPDRRILVVVEVKTRRTSAFGGPIEAVDPRKLARLRRLAALWLREHPVGADQVRIDVIGVECDRFDRLTIEHLTDVTP